MPEDHARGVSAVGVRGSEIYIRVLELTRPYLQDSVATVSSYNTKTGLSKADYHPLLSARDHVGGAIIGNKFYIAGGRDHGQFNVRNDTGALNLDCPEQGWTTSAPMPTARGGLAAPVAGHYLYTFGGEGNPNNPNGVFDDVEVYDTKTNTWEELPPLRAGIYGSSAATSNDIIFIPGGGYKVELGSSNFTLAY